MDKMEQLQELIDQSQRIVFFGGAGVSTESNIPDFRSSDGLYSLKLGRTFFCGTISLSYYVCALSRGIFRFLQKTSRISRS